MCMKETFDWTKKKKNEVEGIISKIFLEYEIEITLMENRVTTLVRIEYKMAKHFIFILFLDNFFSF